MVLPFEALQDKQLEVMCRAEVRAGNKPASGGRGEVKACQQVK